MIEQQNAHIQLQAEAATTEAVAVLVSSLDPNDPLGNELAVAQLSTFGYRAFPILINLTKQEGSNLQIPALVALLGQRDIHQPKESRAVVVALTEVTTPLTLSFHKEMRRALEENPTTKEPTRELIVVATALTDILEAGALYVDYLYDSCLDDHDYFLQFVGEPFGMPGRPMKVSDDFRARTESTLFVGGLFQLQSVASMLVDVDLSQYEGPHFPRLAEAAWNLDSHLQALWAMEPLASERERAERIY